MNLNGCEWCDSIVPVQTPCTCKAPCSLGACPMAAVDRRPTYGPFGVIYDDSEEEAA